MVSTPIGSMQMGGDAKAIIPTDVLEYVNNGILNAQCVPLEFARPTLQIGAGTPPVSFRMFEQTWSFDAQQLDKYINWHLRVCNQLLQWPEMEGSLVKPSIGDDPAMMQILMQGMQEGAVSHTTFYRRFNIDPRMEKKRIMEEQIENYKDDMEMQKIQQRLGFTSDVLGLGANAAMQAGMQAAQAPQEGGQPPAGAGAPPPEQGGEGGGQGGPVDGAVPAPQGATPAETIANMVSMHQQNVSLDQLQADAQQAAQIIVTTPLGVGRTRLYAMIKQHNPTLHAMVKQLVEQMERSAAQQGVEMQRAGELPQ